MPPRQSKRSGVAVCCLLSIFYQVICSLILAKNQQKKITGAQTSLIKQRYFVYHKTFRPWKALYYCKHSIRKNKLSSNFSRWIKASLAWVNSIFYHKTFYHSIFYHNSIYIIFQYFFWNVKRHFTEKCVFKMSHSDVSYTFASSKNLILSIYFSNIFIYKIGKCFIYKIGNNT